MALEVVDGAVDEAGGDDAAGGGEDDEAEAQTGTAVILVARAEPAERIGAAAFGQTRTIIGNGNDRAIALPLKRQAQHAPFAPVFDRIAGKVVEHPGKDLSVAR